MRKVELVEPEVYIPDEGAKKGGQDTDKNRIEVDLVAALWETCQFAAMLGFRMIARMDAEAEEAVAGWRSTPGLERRSFEEGKYTVHLLADKPREHTVDDQMSCDCSICCSYVTHYAPQ